MDLNAISIKIDPGDSASKIAGVVGGLQKVEGTGKTLQPQLAGIAGSFKSLTSALEAESSAYDRLVGSQNAQLASMQAATRASTTWQAALIREREMLDSIHGPAQKLAQDTQALDSLMARGAISAKEYASALASAKQAAGSGPASGGLMQGLGSQLGGLGAIGSLGIAGGAVFAAKELASISDEYTELANRATKFTDSGRSVSQILADQRKAANELNLPLEQMMGAYDDVRDATDKLGLTYNEAIRTQKTFAEASKLSGKSTEQLTGEFLSLSVAFETGGRIAGPLRSLFHDFPDLAEHVTSSLGMTEAQIVKLAASGKLGFEKFAAAMRTNTDDIDGKAKKLDATWGDLYREGKDALFAPIPDTGTMLDAARWDKLSDAQKKAIENAEHMAKVLVKTTDGLRSIDDLTKQVVDTLDKYDFTLGNIEKHFQHGEYASAMAHGLGAIVDQTKNYGEAALKLIGGDDPWDPHRLEDKLNAIKNYHHELTTEEQLLKSINAPMLEANNLIRDSADLYAKGAISVQQWGEQVRKAQEIAGTLSVRSVVSGEGGDFFTPFHNQPGTGGPTPNLNEFDPNKTGQIYAKQFADANAEALKNAGLAYDEFESKARDAISGLDSGWKQIVLDATDSGKHIRDAMTGAFGAVEDSIANMVMKGKLDLGSLGSAVESILVKLAVQQATGGLVGLLGGGMTGFDYMTPGGGGALALPGFATGGDMLVGGAGAPDSKLAMFRVSPGESIHVRTPQQREAAGNGPAAAGPSHTIVNLNYDPRAIQSGRAIQDGVMAVIRKNPAAVRALLGL